MRTTAIDHITRALTVAFLVAVLWPTASNAQAIRRRTGAGAPPRGTPLPPQPGVIRNDLRYRFSKFSMEGYTLYDYVQTSRYVTDKGPAGFGMEGLGTRIEWRYFPLLSFTGDFTSTLYGGPYLTQTISIGTRLHSNRIEERVRPFLDVRGSWAHTYDTYAQPLDNTFTVAPPTFQYARGRVQTWGLGGFVGTGMDFGLTQTLAITSEVGMARHRMFDATLNGGVLGSAYDYNANTMRFVIGLKYTGGRYVTLDPPMSRPK